MSMYATLELEKSGSLDLPQELDPKGEGRTHPKGAQSYRVG